MLCIALQRFAMLCNALLGLVYTVSSLLEQSTPSSLEVQDLDGSVSQLSFSDKAGQSFAGKALKNSRL